MANYNIQAVIFDMDGTALAQKDTSDDVWNRFFAAMGLTEEVKQLRTLYQDYATNTMTRDGHRQFHTAGCRLLTGRNVDLASETTRSLPYTPGFLEFCSYLRKRDVGLGMATLSLAAIAERIKEEAGLKHIIANEIHIADGKFTGMGKINVTFGGKGAAVQELYSLFGATRATTAFFGDSGNDEDAWNAVDHPFGINAKPAYHHLLRANFTDFYQAKEYFVKQYFKKNPNRSKRRGIITNERGYVHEKK